MATMAHRSLFIRYTLGLGMFFYLFCRAVLYCIQKYFLFGWGLGRNYFQGMKEDPAKWPALYLYSETDKLIPFQDVCDIIAIKKERGVDVTEMFWPDSDHVAHFRKHREPYIQQCHAFVDKCYEIFKYGN